MGIRGKFTLLLSSCVVMAVCLTTVAIAHFFAGEQTAFLVDFQTTRAEVLSRQINEKFDLLFAQVDAILKSESHPMERLKEILPSLETLELWQGERRLSRFPTSLATEAPPQGTSRWAFTGLLEVGDTAAVGWIARVGSKTVRLGLKGDWFSDLFRTERGASVELIQPNGEVLVRSEAAETYFEPKVYSLMGGQMPGQPTSTRYIDMNGRPVVGTFLRLPVEPSTLLTLHTPTATISAVVQRTYQYTASITGIFLAVTLALGVIFAASLTRPLRELDRQTRQIAKGDFDIPVVKTSGRSDEVGNLARSFSQMGQDLKKVQIELQHAERLAALGKFSASIAHEIKNPLGGILMNAQLAEQQLSTTPIDSAAVKETLSFVREETWRADRILKNLMKFARQEKPPMKYIDLRDRLKRTFQILKPQFDQAGVLLKLELPPNEIRVRANEDQIQEVLTNLAQNAIHSMRDRPVKELLVRLEITDFIRIELRDTGQGMSEDVKSHLFEPFFTTKPIGEGTGLGLSVCHGILKNHGGKIDVESQLDRGTTFSLLFPIPDAAAEAA